MIVIGPLNRERRLAVFWYCAGAVETGVDLAGVGYPRPVRTRDLVVVVTGASSGIGRATAHAFADHGNALALAARGEAALDDVVQECVERGGRAIAVPTDVSDAQAVRELAQRTLQRYGRIDVWVNNAAVSAFGRFQDVSEEDFRRVLDVNVMGYVHGARAALPVMREQGHGVLVDVSSVVGVVTQPYTHAYTMSKFAVRALSGSLRQELQVEGASGIHVCTVLPATIDTPIFQHAANCTGRAVRAMPPVYPPERVARTIVNLVRRPRREVAVGTAAHALLMQSRLTPGLVERLMAIQVDRQHFMRRPAPATAGNLHRPALEFEAIHGGWDSRQQAARRVAGAAAALLVGTAAAALRRWWR
ncbi:MULTISPECIES: SDR family oxidoreductase [Micromonospora]|uniref:SDR family oxidoreductase n=1 Tax=Micromonospora TaxID=1873 RepID=UPI00191C5472|nr:MULTISPECIES: SDR family oxidoreductase [unclassified Micromonospora]MBM0226400.1 SDR family oxidoreductase [Micromonospora sp. ATA51]